MTAPDYTRIGLIGITSYLASGSTLMHSLLDNHPQITNLPLLTLMNMGHMMSQLPEEAKTSDAVLAFLNQCPGLIDSRFFLDDFNLGRLGENRQDYIKIPARDLAQAVLRHAEAMPDAIPDLPRMALAFSLGWEECLGRDLSKIKWLSYPVHHTKPLALINSFLPRVRLIHTVRDPVQAMISGGRDCFYRFPDMRDYFGHAMFGIDGNGGLADDRGWGVNEPIGAQLASASIGVRLEDVHGRPEETMRALAHWLGVDWHPSLLESTVGGRKWWNRSTSVQISGPSGRAGAPRSGSEWATRFDRWRLSLLIAPKRNRWRYDRAFLQGLPGSSYLALWACMIWPFALEKQEFNQAAGLVFPKNWTVNTRLMHGLKDHIRAVRQIPVLNHTCHYDLNEEKLKRGLWHRRVAFTVTNDTKAREAYETVKPHAEMRDLGPLTAEPDKTLIVLDRGEAESLHGLRKWVFRTVLVWLTVKQYAPVFIRTRWKLWCWHRYYRQQKRVEFAALNPSSPPPAALDPEISPLPVPPSSSPPPPPPPPFVISSITADVR